MSGLTYRILNHVVILCFGAVAPTEAEWNRLLADLIHQCRLDGSLSVLALSRGGGPTVLQRASLARLFGGIPFRIGIVQSSPVHQPLLATLAWLQGTAFVYTPDTLGDAASHFDLPPAALRACLDEVAVGLFHRRAEAA